MDVYTDGACSNNGASNSRAGIGVWSQTGAIELSEPLTGKQTNNSAELQAVISALVHISARTPSPCGEIAIYTDSKYVLTMCNPDRIEHRASYPNAKLIVKLRAQLADMDSVKLHHVPAHTGGRDRHSIGNGHADRLARLACTAGCKPVTAVPPTAEASLAGGAWTLNSDQSLLYLQPSHIPASSMIAAFDIDWTIIRTKSGKVFPTCSRTDWELWAPQVKPTLHKLSKSGYRIVFFSNQGTKDQDLGNWCFKIDSVITALELTGQVTVLAATSRTSNYRKPNSNMWHFLTDELTPDTQKAAYIPQCFFCGDAAGRPKTSTRKRDFSSSDIKFALNIGLPFYTPEQLFLKATDPLHCDRSLAALGFEPRNHWGAEFTGETVHSPVGSELLGSGQQEVLLIVGSPASGKSLLTGALIAQGPAGHTPYIGISQDFLKSKDRCIKAVRTSLQAGNSVIVDNTNRDAMTRALYLKEAERAGVPCRVLWLKTTKEEAFHLNALRALESDTTRLADVVVHSYFKRLEVPLLAEGFSQVLGVPFAPWFETPAHKAQFFQFMF